MNLLWLLQIFSVVAVAHTAKILCISHIPAPSHYILMSTYARALSEAGHDVTVISPFGEKNPPKNGSYRDIILTGVLEQKKEMSKTVNFFKNTDENPFVKIFTIFYFSNILTENTLNHPVVKNFMKSGEKFDAVVVGQLMNDAMKAFAWHFGGHLIVFSTVGANSWVNPLVANPAPPSYIPEIMLNYDSNMNFWQRVYNFLYKAYDTALMQLYFFPRQSELVKEHFPNAPPFYKILYNASLILINGHESLNSAVPHVPSMVDIGGFHVKKSTTKLSKDLQEFMDSAEDGVVYFSMGSNLQSTNLPVEKRDAILKAFSKLKQKVLWKWEDEILPGQPGNVKLGKWLPQQDILAHPNLKVFVTHGGLLSTTEAVYYGVPIIAIPIIADQKMNAQTAETNGYGRVMAFSELTEETFSNLLEEVLNNPKYRKNAKTRSKIMRDRQVQPLDSAVYWTEYVIRHNGAPHLRVAGLELPWYQYHLLDVIAVLLIGAIMVVFVVKKLLGCVWGWLTKKSRKIKKH